MTAQVDFERLLIAWLEQAGPRDIQPAVIESSLAAARRLPQRRGTRGVLSGQRPWPAPGQVLLNWTNTGHFRMLLWLGLVGLLIAGLLIGVLLAGGSRRLSMSGPARNGMIAYSAGGDIYLGDPRTRESRPLTHGPAQDAEPWFAPDGQHVVFFRSTDKPDWEEIVVMDADGSHEHVVTPAPVYKTNWIDWAPDAGVLWFVSEADGATQLQRVNVDGTGYRIMVGGGGLDEPAIRPPDGREVLFRVQSGSTVGLYIMREDGTDRRALIPPRASTNPTYDLRAPRWSPDGTRIAYQEWDNLTGQMHVWIMNADGSAKRSLPHDPSTWFEGWPVWSPDGTHLAIQRGFGNGTFGPDGQPFAVIATDGLHNAVATGPAWWGQGQRVEWSPDGKYLLFKGDSSQQLLLDPGGGPWTYVPWQSTSYPAWQRLPP